MPLNDAIYELIRSFDDEQGLPESAYNATVGIIEAVFGNKAVVAFIKYIDATDGRFYLKEGTAPLLLEEIG